MPVLRQRTDDSRGIWALFLFTSPARPNQGPIIFRPSVESEVQKKRKRHSHRWRHTHVHYGRGKMIYLPETSGGFLGVFFLCGLRNTLLPRPEMTPRALELLMPPAGKCQKLVKFRNPVQHCHLYRTSINDGFCYVSPPCYAGTCPSRSFFEDHQSLSGMFLCLCTAMF